MSIYQPIIKWVKSSVHGKLGFLGERTFTKMDKSAAYCPEQSFQQVQQKAAFGGGFNWSLWVK
jgi:hypothetical protein